MKKIIIAQDAKHFKLSNNIRHFASTMGRRLVYLMKLFVVNLSWFTLLILPAIYRKLNQYFNQHH